MYTPELLLEKAAHQKKVYSDLLEKFPFGTSSDDRNRAGQTAEDCIMCAKWMQDNGHVALAQVGPFYSAPFDAQKHKLRNLIGTKVRVKSGAIVRSLNPNNQPKTVIERSYVVTLHDVHNGYASQESFGQAEVLWMGSEGYLQHADLNDVELI